MYLTSKTLNIINSVVGRIKNIDIFETMIIRLWARFIEDSRPRLSCVFINTSIY